MCGISGIYSNSIGREKRDGLLNEMLKTIKHRGPDNTGIWSDTQISLGHQRLSIIDLSSAAHQPFEYMGMQIVFNGEIYNYIELKKELQQAGFVFQTESDTEVVMAAYKCWGQECVNHFVGMWALALYDSDNKTLFCSRDRFGIKPFYYFQKDGSFFFSSEYKSIKSLPSFDNEINFDMLKRGIALGWAVYKDETYYKNIQVLKPANNLVISDSDIKIYPYWDLEITENPRQKSSEEIVETFFQKFIESVKIHSRSDVTIGGCLSGGMDSSAIASAFCKNFPEVPYKTFTIYYDGNNNVDERPFANEVYLKYPQIQAFNFKPNYKDIAENYHNAMYHADVPLMGASYISQYFLMRLAAQNGVIVILDGQGADEYLGGYMHIFQRILGEYLSKGNIGNLISMLNQHRKLHEVGFQQLIMLLLKSAYMGFNPEQNVYLHEYNRFNNLFSENKQNNIIELTAKNSSKQNEMLYHSIFTTSLPTLLHYEDRNSMAFSIESRVPFLDHRLPEFVFSLPFEYKVANDSATKSILRKALHEVLPAKIVNRHDKKGFVTPGEIEWLNGPLSYLFDEVDYSAFTWLNTKEMKKLLNDYKKGDMANANTVWRLLASNYWLKNFN